jgi:hypothetical protein
MSYDWHNLVNRMAAERENGFVKRMVTSRRAIPVVISNRIELMVALDHERAARPEQFVCAPSRSRPGGLLPLGEPAPFEIQSGHRDVHIDESDSRPYKLLPLEREMLHHMVRTKSVEYDNLVREFEREKVGDALFDLETAAPSGFRDCSICFAALLIIIISIIMDRRCWLVPLA